MVSNANGSAIDRYGSAASTAPVQASVGQGSASVSRAATAGASWALPTSPARSQKISAPAATAANAPGRPSGRRMPPTSASNRIVSATRPTKGSRMILSIGKNAISKMATPAIEPRSAARGTTRRAQSPPKASAHLSAPMAIVTTMPTFHASTGSPVAIFTGPRTPKTIANSVGVSMPNGIAVTSSRPVRRPSRIAITV
jgi:hypothetical protein